MAECTILHYSSGMTFQVLKILRQAYQSSTAQRGLIFIQLTKSYARSIWFHFSKLQRLRELRLRKAIKNTILTNIWSIVIVTGLLLRTSAISRVSFDFLICTNYVSGDFADKIALLKKMTLCVPELMTNYWGWQLFSAAYNFILEVLTIFKKDLGTSCHFTEHLVFDPGLGFILRRSFSSHGAWSSQSSKNVFVM